jgi:hypothetical protein
MRTGERLSKVFREPLFHFLLLGAGLFLLYALVARDDGQAPERIVVTEAEISRLAAQFQRTWMRPPTREELQGLAEDYVLEEILYREALALGLDQDDLVVRRRMRQKMEFLNSDLVELEAPTDDELSAFLDANSDKFRRPIRTSFVQVYVRATDDPQEGRQRIDALRERLVAEPALDPQGLGDSSLLPSALADATEREIARHFGQDFASAVVHAPLDAWSGPYASAYGVHLVRVDERKPGGLPVLTEVRATVEREWAAERRQVAKDRFHQGLRDRYEVEIELPKRSNMDSIAVR